MTDAISDAVAMMRAVGETASAKYEHAREQDVFRLNMAIKSMRWLASRIETDDEAKIIMVAIRSALSVGYALNPDQWDTLNAKLGPPRTEKARGARTAKADEWKTARRSLLAEYLADRANLSSSKVTKLAASLLADQSFRCFFEARAIKLPSKTYLVEDLRSLLDAR
jgi:epoxyqueuosine reductase QueG